MQKIHTHYSFTRLWVSLFSCNTPYFASVFYARLADYCLKYFSHLRCSDVLQNYIFFYQNEPTYCISYQCTEICLTQGCDCKKSKTNDLPSHTVIVPQDQMIYYSRPKQCFQNKIMYLVLHSLLYILRNMFIIFFLPL